MIHIEQGAAHRSNALGPSYLSKVPEIRYFRAKAESPSQVTSSFPLVFFWVNSSFLHFFVFTKFVEFFHVRGERSTHRNKHVAS